MPSQLYIFKRHRQAKLEATHPNFAYDLLELQMRVED